METRNLTVAMLIFLVYVITAQKVAGQQSDAYWGSWEKWSDCSRSCGGGVTKSTRACVITTKNTTNSSCGGNYVRYQMCNIQDCPDNSVDYRMLQCSNFNKKPYKGKYYKWAGFSHSAGECELKCMPKNNFFYVTFDQKVADGTKCNDFSLDVCVNGTCVPVGCDMQLYSKARVDNCGVCNGDDSKCKNMKGSFKLVSDAYGYVDVVTIPAGATSIKITEDYKTTNFLAVTSNGKNVLNADYAISSSFGTRRYQGHVIKYERSQRLNQIKIDGPVDLPLQFHVYVARYTKRPIIYKYEYYMSNSFNGDGNTIYEYDWIIGDWSKCSKKCAHGQRTRIVYCAKKNTQTKVEAFNCDVRKPITEEDCATQACPARWYISQWSPCSKSCGKGLYTRRVHCVETVKDGNVKMLDFKKCPGKAPIQLGSCFVKKVCPTWKAKEWAECSKSCGNGIQSRIVKCVAGGDYKVDDAQCQIDKKPSVNQECHNFPCGAQWVAEQWSQCSSVCGVGMRHRKVTCNNRAGIAVPRTHCNSRHEPSHFEDCQVVGPCKPMWHSSEWSKCSAKCGYGMQIRVVTCAELNSNNKFLVAEERHCSSQTKPDTTRRCAEAKPCQVNYFVSKWGKCSVSCGIGYKMRDVRCYADRQIDYSQKYCANMIKPTQVKICTKPTCPLVKEKDENEVEDILTTTAEPVTADPFTPTSEYDTITSTKTPEYKGTSKITKTSTKVAIVTNPSQKVKSVKPSKTSKARKPTKPRKRSAAKIVYFHGPVDIKVNKYAEYKCVANGYPNPGVNWSYGGKSISSFFGKFKLSKKIVGDKLESRLFVRSSRVSDDAKDLKCFVRNIYGWDASVLRIKISASPTVKVTQLPTERRVSPAAIVSLTGPVNIKVNEEAGYKCITSGNPSPTVQWTFQNKPIGNFFGSFKLASNIQANGEVVNRLIIQSKQPTDGKALKCSVKNKAGSDSETIHIKIADVASTSDATTDAQPDISKTNKPLPVTVTDIPKVILIKETPAKIVSLSGPVKLESGENADYQCIAGGSPPPTVSWKVNGKPLDPARFRVLNSDIGSRLVVLTASYSDTGDLTCIASNSLGSDSSKLSIKVSGVPLVSIYPKKASYKEGNQVTLTCRAEGSPTPQIQWGKDGRIFFGDNKRVIVLQDRIIFKGILPRDSGKYFCKGYNPQGTNIDSLSVSIERNDGTRISTCVDDNTRADCRLIASLSRLCSIPHYNSVCCETCRGRV